MSIIDNRVIEEQLEKQLQEYYCHNKKPQVIIVNRDVNNSLVRVFFDNDVFDNILFDKTEENKIARNKKGKDWNVTKLTAKIKWILTYSGGNHHVVATGSISWDDGH